jgi:hypothetical protein
MLAGEVSLQNSLELSLRSLKYESPSICDENNYSAIYILQSDCGRQVPTHATREVVVIMGSLTTCDPGNIFDTIKVAYVWRGALSLQTLAKERVRVSIIGLAAQVRVCQTVCEDTGGTGSPGRPSLGRILRRQPR